MQVILDNLSLTLLALIVLATLLHLFLLRKPEPAIHPLLLGRQSDLARVRKPNESPAFVSGSAGLGGLARHALQGIHTPEQLWRGRNADIAIGQDGGLEPLDGKVDAVKQELSGAPPNGLLVKIDDPTDAFLTILAATSLAQRDGGPAATVLSPAFSLPSSSTANLAISSAEIPALLETAIPMQGSPSGSDLFVVNPGRAPTGDKAKVKIDKLHNLKIHQVFTGDLKSASGPTGDVDTNKLSAAPHDTCMRMQAVANGHETMVDLTNKNLINGGVLSLLSVLPGEHRFTAADRILSFEHPSTPWGLTVALSAVSTGATLRLCSPSRGIVTKCRAFAPSVIFCSPNELNAIRAALVSQFPAGKSANPSSSLASGGVVTPMAHALKLSLLRSGNVSKTTFWDRLVFSKVRGNVVGQDLRLIVCSADEGSGPAEEVVDYLRIVLGIPIIVSLTHPCIAGPVTNTLYHDYQSFGKSLISTAPPSATARGTSSHVGGPSTAMECKLVDVSEDDALNGTYRGQLVLRGPSVPRCTRASQSAAGDPGATTTDGWLKSGVTVELKTNGTLKVISPL